jgi:glycosyltransferase involved in cell wall biosynthesis
MKPLCVVSCPIDTFSGYGARSRDFVNALIKEKDSEWDIKILPQMWGETPWNFLDDNDSLKQRFIPGLDQNNQPDIWMQITVPNEFQSIGKSFNVGITAGIETTVFPAEFIEGMNRMDLNLISSNHSKNVAVASSFEKKDKTSNQTVSILKLEKPCEVLFEGLDLDKYYKKPQNSGLLKDIKEEFCFLFTGHWLQGNFGEDRKDVATLIKTFYETFNTASKKKPALILKTNSVNYSLIDREHILKHINKIKNQVSGNLPNVYLLHGEMTDNEMNQLNNDDKVKAFVSFTKGEGYGRPLAEAAITGKPVIVSNWSGHIDFINKEYNVLIGGSLKKVHKSAANQFLLADSQWFNINREIAGRAMKDVFKNYKRYWESSRKQTQYLKDNFSFDKMAELLNKLMPKVEAAPKIQPLNLPKLQKIGNKTPNQPLQKINIDDNKNNMNWRGTDIELPNLKKIQI